MLVFLWLVVFGVMLSWMTLIVNVHDTVRFRLIHMSQIACEVGNHKCNETFRVVHKHLVSSVLEDMQLGLTC